MSDSSTSVLQRSKVRISGATGPTKQTIVLLHGLGSHHTNWRFLTPAFEKHYQVVLLDLNTSGNLAASAYSTTHGALNGHASQLLAVMKALALHDAVFVGHSVGAMIGMLAAVREPERFAKMVLISPSPRFINGEGCTGGFEQKDIAELLAAMEGDRAGWSHGFAPAMMGTSERPELVMELSNSFVQSNPEIVKHFARVNHFSDARAELGFFTIPTLVVQSAHDVIAPLAVGHYINEQLADSRMVVVETAGDCPHLSAPAKTLAAIEDFMHGETVLR